MKGTIQAGFVNPAALEWTRANYGISALSVHERAISILRAQEQDTPSMKLNVNGGAYSYNGVMHLFIGEESPEFTAPAEGTRLDILYLDGESGELAIQEGTAAVAITDPLELPAVPSGAIPLVAVHLAAEQEAITESDLYDLRAFIASTKEDKGCRVYNSGNQSISNATWTALTFDSEVYDTDGMHSTSTNTSRLTCVTAGKYLVHAAVTFAANATGSRWAAIKKNGSFYANESRPNAGSGSTVVFHIDLLVDLAVNNYVELFVLQTSGGNLDVNGGNAVTAFAAQRLV